MIDQHTLIAGATGSGKSVLLHLLLSEFPQCQKMVIDLKRVEFVGEKKKLLMYADDLQGAINLLEAANRIINKRLKKMQRKGMKKTSERSVLVVIDELIPLTKGGKRREAVPLLERISTIGRAAGVFLVACTQRPTNDTITPVLSANFSVRYGCRTTTAWESRNIIFRSGCEKLPLFGYCYKISPATVEPELLKVEKG